LAVSETVIANAKEGKLAEVESTLIGPSKQAREDMGRNIEAMVELNGQGTSNEVDAALGSYQSGRLITVATLACSALLGVGLALVIARWFTRAIVQVDEISSSVASASQELAAASQHLSSSAQESASSLEETASSLEEITATVRQNADNADQANQLANSSRETAEQGGAVVAKAVDAMGEINRSSRKIADIITTVDEIAFQTNLLALNAAVEAARAGEQGRGFAVVAGEVRNLAQRSATAAREIKGLIEDSVHKVEAGSELVNRSGETLGAIVSSVKRVTDIVAEIAAASREQTIGIEQINKAVAHMDQAVQSTAAQMEELSGTAMSLSGQSEQLQVVVEQFHLKQQQKLASVASVARSRTASNERARGNVPARVATTSPRKTSPKAELLGAGIGHDGFEEF
jgi:methyl-accepting chemotaxis protein